MTDTATTESFTALLRIQTAGDHRNAEQAPFMKALLSGELPLAGYTDMLAQHAYAYAALESPSETVAADPTVAALSNPGLLRSAALIADLTALVGEDWQTVHPATPATERYVARLREVGDTWAGGYAAHHYTRYLGDLSGGQFIGRIAAKAYGLERGVNDNFAHFDLGDLAEFKTAYKAHLDAAPWDHAEKLRVIEEIQAAYRYNSEVFEDLNHHGA